MTQASARGGPVTHDVVAAALDRLERAGAGPIDVAMVLGSGLSVLADHLEDPVRVPYREIDGFPQSTVPGHAGNFVVGTLEGRTVGMAQGRFHLYEGYEAREVVLPIRVLHALGARALLVTNAAGSLDRRRPPGTLMAIRDQMNLQFANPLAGSHPTGRTARMMVERTETYDPGLLALLHATALEQTIRLREGVYAGLPGPTYETPAEIRFLKRAGADAVGMSTVGEAIAAASLGMPVAGVSLLTNYAAGLTRRHLTHDEVTRVAERTRHRLERLVRGFVRRLDLRS
ncbi:MAG TPA: purine-nucleoside phosphorylase [Gemmatimonadota bacterium]|nr:purine-nucleoside phosphorylase [Gemmatimonadota bacterium]